MKTLTEQLTQYAAYHRDPRNIRTHFVGIPMIVLSVTVLLAGMATPLVLLATVATAVYYFRLDLRYGLVMALFLGACVGYSLSLAAQPGMGWLGTGIGLFVVGWIIQFIGHYYEGRKPAFVDDLMGLIIGPLFVAAEFGFLMGLRKDVQTQIESRVGPVRLNPHAEQTAS
jgi:uncharacterized membrane protein YGL010W